MNEVRSVPVTGALKLSMVQAEAHLEVKTLAMAATRGLVRLDADLLQALERKCEMLTGRGDGVRAERAVDRNELATLARVLETSRANLNVLRQLNARRLARSDYGVSSSIWPERGNGEH